MSCHVKFWTFYIFNTADASQATVHCIYNCYIDAWQKPLCVDPLAVNVSRTEEERVQNG